MKKLLIGYGLFVALIWSYFLFAYPLDSFGKSNFASLSHAMFFTTVPLDWFLLLGIIRYQSSQSRYSLTTNDGSFSFMIWFCIKLFGLYLIIKLPFDFIWYEICKAYGISQQPYADWFFDFGLSYILFCLGLLFIIILTRYLMKKFKKAWWFALWLLTIPIALFLVYIQPIWIDPLYNDFQPMEDGELKQEILKLTEDAGIEDVTLLQVNKSTETTTFNAYVNGIFGNAQIVVWDTTIQGMEKDEILFILAHEIGHYVKHHVLLGVSGYLLMSFVVLWLLAVIFRKWWGMRESSEPTNVRAIPYLLLIASLLLFLFQPISMWVSREIETSADQYAMDHTEELQPAADSFQRLAIQSQSDISPAWWIKWLRFSHPTIQERIEMVENEMKSRDN
ncbi:M48 family metalloprotease [Radiobacillus kanasensis]|uniref:M48 family metalloprotease n=1 Tax=Radiobacillus kanasensis TaxID=2844358 RepID=UPI001E2C3B32|nr:M48 family metalloprotease [Radiobacillus kanasensis]UFU00514.1 M48 family metalloprotease [Radiobacillus kanasensis]